MGKIRSARNSALMISPFLSVRISGEKIIDGHTQVITVAFRLSHSLAQERYVLSQQEIGPKPDPLNGARRWRLSKR
jgi:hypothetical protein